MSRPLTTLLACALLSLIPSTLLTRQEGQEEEHEETELEEHMHKIEDSLRKLRRSLRDESKRDASLEEIAAMQREALEAKLLTPSMAEALPAAERAAMIRAFRRTMVDVIAGQLELEAAILDGDQEAARAAFRKVHDMEDAGHERFTIEEEEE